MAGMNGSPAFLAFITFISVGISAVLSTTNALSTSIPAPDSVSSLASIPAPDSVSSLASISASDSVSSRASTLASDSTSQSLSMRTSHIVSPSPGSTPITSSWAGSLNSTNQTSSAYSPPTSIKTTIQQTPSFVHGTSSVPENQTNPTTEGKAEDEGKGEGFGSLTKWQWIGIGVGGGVFVIILTAATVICCRLKKSKFTVKPVAEEHRLESTRDGNPESVS